MDEIEQGSGRKRKKERRASQGQRRTSVVGSDVLSHTVTHAVPSALASLTTGFEMCPGGPSPLQPPTPLARLCPRTRFTTDSSHAHTHTHSVALAPRQSPRLRIVRLRFRPLVRVSCTHCCASTSRLSNWSSPSGLMPSRARGSPLEVGFPLRCFQRFSAPMIATRHCTWRHNRHTSASSSSVLSY